MRILTVVKQCCTNKHSNSNCNAPCSHSKYRMDFRHNILLVLPIFLPWEVPRFLCNIKKSYQVLYQSLPFFSIVLQCYFYDFCNISAELKPFLLHKSKRFFCELVKQENRNPELHHISYNITKTPVSFRYGGKHCDIYYLQLSFA